MDYFRTHELVCPHVYKKWGDRALKFADPRILKWIAWFRPAINKSVVINNYGLVENGKYDQRGYRCNLCSLVAEKTKAKTMYLSAHTRFQALDLSVGGMTDQEVRDWIDQHKEEMPVNIRVELDTVGWVHIDVACSEVGPKITYFNP